MEGISEIFFLTKFYNQNITDFDVYTSFIEHQFIIYEKKQTTIENVQKDIFETHKIKIPIKVIELSTKDICKKYDSIKIQNNRIAISSIPLELSTTFQNFNEQYNETSRNVYDFFKKFCEKSGYNKLTFNALQDALLEIRDTFTNSDVSANLSHSRLKNIQLSLSNPIWH